MHHIRYLRRAAAIVVLLGLTACATTPAPVLTESVGTLRTGIGAAREQSRLAFEAANHLARDQAVERVLDDKRKVSLAQADFPFAVDPADISKWLAAFSALDAYTASLQQLLDPKLPQATGDSLQGLGEQLQTGKTINASLPSGVAATFATFGQGLISAKAEKTATDVMRRMTPAFNELMTGMATAIGTDNSSDLRGTVNANWNAVLARIRSTFASTKPDDRDARRRVIQQFLDALDARDTQLAGLDQLRSSLLALGEAHAAAGRGSRGEALFWIEQIHSWLDDIKARTEAIQQNVKEHQK
jgi:hypothetical protein